MQREAEKNRGAANSKYPGMTFAIVYGIVGVAIIVTVLVACWSMF